VRFRRFTTCKSHIGIVIEPNEKEQLKEFVDGLNNGYTEAGR
jgi:hypothetical protein